MITPEEVRARDPRRIMTDIGRQFGVTLRDITGHSRAAPIMRARLAAIHAVRLAHPDMSVKRLGRNFGARDHTSILCALRRIERDGVPQPPANANMEAVQ
ncbi:helix-turn-helix domain-containing protein [Methylorubrum suomiense]